MSDAVDCGITVTEIAPVDQPIDVSPETTAAFVGRALRGPLNTPVLVSSFGEFRRRFGDIWSRSSLGPAVRQFFEHGGKRLYIIRVANNARGSMICLPASGSALVLRAVEPGSTEFIRAAVDYDGIEDDDEDLFNLALQRIDPGTGLIEDQELFSKVSFCESSDKFVGDRLLTSSLARVEHPYPSCRPEMTMDAGGRIGSTYIDHVQAGTDGTELSDYDLIGSRKNRTGLFALEQIDNFDVLYLPAPGKGIDAGPAAILAAEMFCRKHHAVLIVDPGANWETAHMAAKGVRELGYTSPNMLGYFPRMRERGGDDTPRPVGGAIAGLLCKLDRTYGPWQDLDQQGLGLRRQLVPAVDVREEDAQRLFRTGLNVISGGRSGRARIKGAVTMGRGREAHRKFGRLPARRFCLQVVNTIAAAARWAVFEQDDRSVGERICAQVRTYFDCLNDLGAFVHDRFIVECDAGVSPRSEAGDHAVTIVLVFHPVSCNKPVSLTLHLSAAGCRVGDTAFAPSIVNFT